MNEDWKITYTEDGNEDNEIFTAPSLLDAISQYSDLGYSLTRTIKIEKLT